jgi:hypothetical protein
VIRGGIMEELSNLIVEYSTVDPYPKALVMSLRSFGYDITTAIADIIDNSIAAGAKNIWIEFIWNEKQSSIAVIDDGEGMSEKELIEAMRLGTKSPLDKREKNDLGRFGLGLKTASFSQCKILTVATKRKKENLQCRQWDLDLIVDTNKWSLKAPDLNIDAHSKYYSDINEQGTIVYWENLDKMFQWDTHGISNLYDYFLSITESVKEHISKIYGSFNRGTKKINFWINGRKIDMWDPFLADNSFTKLLGEDEIFLDKNKKVTIRPYILPHHTKLSADQYALAAGNRGWGELQGFYVYRNNRLIISGDWLDPRLEKKEAYRLARIRIDIDNTMDDVWNIDVKKANANPPESLKKDLKRIAKLARKESSNIFLHRGKEVARSADKTNSFVWKQKDKEGKFFFEINRNYPLIRELLDDSVEGRAFEQVLKIIEASIPIPMIVKKDSENPGAIMQTAFSDEELRNGFEHLYKMFEKAGKSHDECITIIEKLEPFMYFQEIIDLYRRKLG